MTDVKIIRSMVTTEFDKKVCAALKDGYTIIKLGQRFVGPGPMQNYAFMVKSYKARDLIEYARALRDACISNVDCNDCPISTCVCDIDGSPANWEV